MAHFAEVDATNIVRRVVVMPDDATPESCEKLLGVRCGACDGCKAEPQTDCAAPTQWVQTSYTSSIRTRYAGVGFEWHEDLDAFVRPPKGEKNDFTLDEVTKAYVPVVKED